MDGHRDDDPAQDLATRSGSRMSAGGSPYLQTPVLGRGSIDSQDDHESKCHYGDKHDDYSDEDEYHHEREGLIASHDISPSDPSGPRSSVLANSQGLAIVTDDDGGAQARASRSTPSTKAKRVSWLDLPKKDQLILLTLTRLSEPLTQTSLQAYMFFQLKRFGPSLPDSDIAAQIGFLQAAFTGAQFCTSMIWGRLADSDRVGRKPVILIGLLGTSLGALGFGFSGSFYTALFWRAFGGALNGNVGILRAMVSETIKEKKYQPTAFLLLPMTFNIGVIIGPVLGGLLADPVNTYPHIFGPGGTIGGTSGVQWMARWPYALPNLVMAFFLIMSAMAVVFGLKETHEALQHQRDRGLEVTRWIATHIFRRRINYNDYSPLSASSDGSMDIELQHATPSTPRPRQKLPFRRIWTRNLILTLVAHGLLACHIGAFSSLWFVFLSTARYISPDPGTPDPNITLNLPLNYNPSPPLRFTGGLGLPSPIIGTSLAILGIIGLILQILIYPRVTHHLGTTRSYRLSTLLFPLTYTLVPFLALVPTLTSPPSPADGPRFWSALLLVLAIQVTGRTFALPAAQILLNNACPHPSVLATVHSVGQTVSSAARTLGPVVGGWAYGLGLRKGYVGACWWGLSGVAIVGAVAGRFVRDGSGWEIVLEGEEWGAAERAREEKAGESVEIGTGSAPLEGSSGRDDRSGDGIRPRAP